MIIMFNFMELIKEMIFGHIGAKFKLLSRKFNKINNTKNLAKKIYILMMIPILVFLHYNGIITKK